MDWLLEPDQPAVRYMALVDLLGQSRESPEAREARSEIASRGWAKDILKKQKPQGYWELGNDLYRPKYPATIWRVIVLGDLGLTKDDSRIRMACQLLLSRFSQPDGGFDDSGGSEVCVTGNLARTLVNCGHGDDPRVKSAYD